MKNSWLKNLTFLTIINKLLASYNKSNMYQCIIIFYNILYDYHLYYISCKVNNYYGLKVIFLIIEII